MVPQESRARMAQLRRTVRKTTVFDWARECLAALDEL
jgi:trehalose-6-phosphate synthase